MANFENLTPHIVRIFGQEGDEPVLTIPPSGEVARCSVESEQVGEKGGVSLFATTFGQVEGLPAPQPDTVYIVSMLVRSAVSERTDVASPGELIRDDEGRPMGCRGLNVNR